MRKLRFIAIAFAVSCFGQTAANHRVEPVAQAVAGYKLYRNERYGFSVLYPQSFLVQGPSENGDGQGFRSPDGSASLDVSGSNNVLGDTSETVYDADLKQVKGTLGYCRLSVTWFVITSEDHGSVTYQKTYVGAKSQNTFVLTYPATRRDEYNPMVNIIEKSFHSGTISLPG